MAGRVEPEDQRIYATRLTPYRSLTPAGFKRLIVGIGCAAFLLSLPFFFMGAWPVAGFMGLDVLALFIAFKINFRSAGAYETVDVTRWNWCSRRFPSAVSERSGFQSVLGATSATGRARRVWH